VKWQARNSDDATTIGAQLFIDHDFNQLFHTTLRYQFINKTIDDNAVDYKYGRNFIKHQVSCGFHTHFWGFDQSFNLLFKKKPHRRGWLIAGVRFSKKIQDTWDLYIDVANFFNEEYQEIEGIAGEKRRVEAGIRFEW